MCVFSPMHKLWVWEWATTCLCTREEEEDAFSQFPACPPCQQLLSSDWCSSPGCVWGVWVPWPVKSISCSLSAWHPTVPVAQLSPGMLEYWLLQQTGKACSFPLHWEYESSQLGECWLVRVWPAVKSSLEWSSWAEVYRCCIILLLITSSQTPHQMQLPSSCETVFWNDRWA